MTKRSVTECPEARNEGLLTEHVGDELVIFDAESNEAHALQPLAAAVFEAADGRTSIADLATSTGIKLGREVEVSEIDAALTELESVGLLYGSGDGEGVSRRRLLQVGGVAAAGILVSSALVPALAAASTTCKPTKPGTLPCGLSEFAIIFQKDGTHDYYWAKITPSSYDCNDNTFFTICSGDKVYGWPASNGTFYKFQTGACPAGVSITQGASGMAVEIPAGYTLVAWYYHNGTTCKKAQQTGCGGGAGCIQINPCW